MAGYHERDAAKDTRSTEREATAAWHQARDDSGVRQGDGGDRPTPRQRQEGRKLTERARERADDRPPPERPER